MSLLLSATKDLLLGMSDQSYDRAVFLDLTQILFDFFFAQIISPFQLSLRECLLLRFGPIFSIFRQIELWREIEKVLSTFSNGFINASQHTFYALTLLFFTSCINPERKLEFHQVRCNFKIKSSSYFVACIYKHVG